MVLAVYTCQLWTYRSNPLAKNATCGLVLDLVLTQKRRLTGIVEHRVCSALVRLAPSADRGFALGGESNRQVATNGAAGRD